MKLLAAIKLAKKKNKHIRAITTWGYLDPKHGTNTVVSSGYVATSYMEKLLKEYSGQDFVKANIWSVDDD